jgi:hypothetical protein
VKLDLQGFEHHGRGFVAETREATLGAAGPCGLDLCLGLPPSVRLPTTPVLDQGAASTCLANAICDGVLVKARIQGVHKARLFSRLWLYLHARADVTVDSGIAFSAAVNALAMRGAPAEEHWPYYAEGVFSMPPFEAAQHAWSEAGKFKFHTLATAEQACAAMAQACPVVAGFGSTFGGPHAVLLVGYERDTDGLHVLVKNSWGEHFGDGGYVWLSAETLDNDCIGLLAVDWAPSPTEDAK